MAMIVIAWVVVFGLFFAFFDDWGQRQYNPNTAEVLTRQAPAEGGVTLESNRSGHYVAEGEINGQLVTFVVDTGATQVALSTELARRLNLPLGPRVLVQTANGPSTGYATRLDSVRLGPLEANDTAALVTDGLDGDTVLLGMSFLRHFEFTQRGDQLTLRPYR